MFCTVKRRLFKFLPRKLIRWLIATAICSLGCTQREALASIFQIYISYKIMMKNDYFLWENWLGPQQAMHSV